METQVEISNEEWKSLDFLGYSRYQISNMGNLKNIKSGRISSGCLVGKCYKSGIVNDKKIRLSFNIHYLVATAFIGYYSSDTHIVDHIDGNSLNNKLSNLRWITKFEQACDQKETQIEEWRSLDFLGYSKYQVSNMGNVKSLKFDRINMGATGPGGYYVKSMSNSDNKTKTFKVHYLVARAFIGPPPDDTYTVDHIDRNPKNNDLSNLRWATKSEQRINQVSLESIKSNKPVVQITIDGKTEIMTWLKLKDAAKFYNIEAVLISKACKTGKSAIGYFWKHATDSIPGEEWKQLPSDEFDSVFISNFGRYHKKKSNRIGFGSNISGYRKVSLKKLDGTRVFYLMHRLVALIFLGKNDTKFINHMDGNKSNNKVENLEYVTREENAQHAVKLGLRNNISPNMMKRRVNQYDKQGNFIATYPSLADASRKTEISAKLISGVCRGVTKSTGGFKWAYAK